MAVQTIHICMYVVMYVCRYFQEIFLSSYGNGTKKFLMLQEVWWYKYLYMLKLLSVHFNSLVKKLLYSFDHKTTVVGSNFIEICHIFTAFFNKSVIKLLK